MAKTPPAKLKSKSAEAVSSVFLTRPRMLALLAETQPKCRKGDVHALSRALEIVWFTKTPLPYWLEEALQQLLEDAKGSKVIGTGPRATVAANRARNWIDMQRYLLVRPKIKELEAAGTKVLDKQVYELEISKALVKSGVWAKSGAIKDSYLRIDAALKSSMFIPEDYYPGQPEDLQHLLGQFEQE